MSDLFDRDFSNLKINNLLIKNWQKHVSSGFNKLFTWKADILTINSSVNMQFVRKSPKNIVIF